MLAKKIRPIYDQNGDGSDCSDDRLCRGVRGGGAIHTHINKNATAAANNKKFDLIVFIILALLLYAMTKWIALI